MRAAADRGGPGGQSIAPAARRTPALRESIRWRPFAYRLPGDTSAAMRAAIRRRPGRLIGRLNLRRRPTARYTCRMTRRAGWRIFYVGPGRRSEKKCRRAGPHSQQL